MEEDESHNIFLYVMMITTLMGIGGCIYFFYYKKEFPFTIEIPCDPSIETCVLRDCTIPGVCPLNKLAIFKKYVTNGADFAKCENENCTLACTTAIIKCVQIECEEDIEAEETCSVLENFKKDI